MTLVLFPWLKEPFSYEVLEFAALQHRIIILECDLQNLIILYNKIKYDNFEMLHTFSKVAKNRNDTSTMG